MPDVDRTPAAEGGTILLVEDNPHEEALARRALAKAGVTHPIAVARDGEQALAYLLGDGGDADGPRPGLPLVVLLDLHMPKVGGLEVLERLREHQRTRLLPVVVLSSSDDAREVAESYRLGASSYVRKPVDSDRFAATVGQVGAYWTRVNRPPPGREQP